MLANKIKLMTENVLSIMRLGSVGPTLQPSSTAS